MNFESFTEKIIFSNILKPLLDRRSISVKRALFQFVAAFFFCLATSQAVALTPPSAPTGLVATGNTGAVGLAWNASSGATSYNILRSGTSGSGYTAVANGVTSTAYNDSGLANGTSYYYVVTAANASGTSGYSNEASATTNTIVGTWSRGTGLFSGITLGALQNSSVVNQAWPAVVNYSLDLNSWPYDVYVPANYDGSKPYGVVVYITSDPTTGIVLQTASTDKNVIWIAPRNVGNHANSPDRYGAALMATYRAKELFNIDPRRVYTSGKSGGARTASALAFYHSEVYHGTAPSSGFSLPRLNEVTPDYIPNTSGQSDTYFDYADSPFEYYYFNDNALHNSIDATAKARKLRSYIITRYGDYREDYFVEGFHCAYEPQGETCFLYDGPGTHQDATDAEMEEAISYLDRDDVFPVNANITAGANGFAGMTDISQAGATAASATTSGTTTYTLTPTLTAVAAAKTGTNFYWDNTNGSTVRWLWEVQNAAPTNQKTCFGFWFANETWGGGAPVSVTSGTNPGILITITQNGSQNRLVISARSDAGGETIFYDGYFSFVPAYSTAWTSTQTGYLTGTGSPVELRMDLNQKRWQLTFNGISLNTTNSIANGTQIGDDSRLIFGYWDSALGTSFWYHDPNTAWDNTWSAFTKSIFTVATGAISVTGSAPSPMGLRYVIASDPNLPAPLPVGPTGLTAAPRFGKIDLAWNALPGATSYVVKRSTNSGGPYITLLSNFAGTSYSDPTITTGTLYYYVVSAITASGSTANCSEASAGFNVPLVRSTGGTASASSENPPNETAVKAFDGTTSTKWLGGAPAWLQYQFASGSKWAISQYSISSANDVPARDPKDWQVLGSHDGTNWTVLDSRTGQTFANRYQTNSYTISSPAEFEFYRLNILANSGTDSTQLSEWQLVGVDSIPPVITTPGNIVVGTSGTSAIVNFNVTANDGGDGAVAVQCTPTSGSTFPIGSTTVNCVATDKSGNSSQRSFSVTVDPTVPVINVPANITVAATSNWGAPVTFTTSATDSNGACSTVDTPASGSVFPVGVSTVTTTATSSGGKTASKTFTVTVQPYFQRAWLKFDEDSGTIASDATGNGWTGTLSGASWTAGKINNGISLSGATQFVSLPSGVVSGLTDFTIATWVKLNSISNWVRIFDFGTGQTSYMFLTPKNGANNVVRFAITTAGGGGEQIINGTSALPTGVWTHVAVTLSGSTGTLYVNGTAVGTNNAMTLKPSSLGTTTANYVGKSQYNDPYLNGVVDEFQIYNQALTGAQIVSLASSLSAPAVSAGIGKANVPLSWSAVSGVTGYRVKRALTSGGPYTAVASTTGTSYLDSGLTNGTAYYYVVTAFNALAESANSSEVSSTPDGTPPVIDVPANITTQPTSANGAVVSFTTSAIDAVSGPCTTTNTPASGSLFPIGTTTVTTTASDQLGNSGTATFTVTVQSLPVSAAEQQNSSAISLTGTAGTLVFKASVPGHSYQLQYCDDLAAGVWQNFGHVQAGNSADLHFDLPVDATKARRFYRIQITRY